MAECFARKAEGNADGRDSVTMTLDEVSEFCYHFLISLDTRALT